MYHCYRFFCIPTFRLQLVEEIIENQECALDGFKDIIVQFKI